MAPRKLRSVLCVDDDEDICEVVQATLCLIAGLDVQTAQSGEESIALALELRPDLVLMDIMMPGLDGPSTFKRMRETPRLADIPVIFLTAKVMPSEVEQLLRLGAHGVITKPFDPLKLGEQVSALWNRADTVRATRSAPSRPAQVHAHIDALAVKFLGRATGDVMSLRTLIERARQGHAPALEEVERIAHSIHGTAAMLGFLSVSALAEAIERLVAGIRQNAEAHGPIGDSALVRQLSDCTERLAKAVETAASMPPSGAGMLHRRNA